MCGKVMPLPGTYHHMWHKKLTFSMDVISWIACRRSWMDLPLFLTHPTPHKADTMLAEAITLGLYLENLNSVKKKTNNLHQLNLLFDVKTETNSCRDFAQKEKTENQYLLQVQLIRCNRLVREKETAVIIRWARTYAR